MPIYEYRCDKSHTFEVMQRMTDDPVSKCEVCGLPVQRVFHPVAVHFKGKGFYNTDYGTKKRQRETAAAAEGSSSEGGGSEKSEKSDKSTEKSSSGDSASSNGTAKGAGDKPAKKAESAKN